MSWNKMFLKNTRGEKKKGKKFSTVFGKRVNLRLDMPSSMAL
jgi:hypothetical protein